MRPRAGRKSLTDEGGHPLLTRGKAAQLAQVSTMTIRRWERNGRLPPIVVDEVHYFTRASVIRAVGERDGHCSARAFELFEAGKNAVETVRELNEDPEYIGRLFDGYQRLVGNVVVKAPTSPKQWAAVYGVPLDALSPSAVLKCIEIVFADPKLKAQLGFADNTE